MTTRNKRKLAALNKEDCEEHPRSNLPQNSSAPRSQEDYITQVSEEIEGRVTKRLSKEFSRTENRILGALARLDDFLMNPLLPGGSGTTPEPTRNASSINQGTNEDDSQNDPHPEASLFHVRGNKTLAQKVTMTWWQELTNRHATAMTWWQELQNATTWWEQFRKRVSGTMTWWQELQKWIGIATKW